MSRVSRLSLNFNPVVIWAGLALLGLAAVWILSVAVQQGLGLGNDSVAYIGGAQSLLAGKGYSRIWLTDQAPITHFPPLLSMLFVLGALGGAEVNQVAFWLIVALYGMNTFLVGLLAWRMSRLAWVGWLAALLFTLNHNLLRVHSFVMSEPLFLFLSLLFFLFLYQYFRSRRLGWMLALGGLGGLAFLTRYVALALFPLAAVSVVILERPFRRCLAGWAAFAAVSLPILLAWLVRNSLVGGSATNRQVIWHPVNIEKIQFGLENLWSLFLPVGLVERMKPYQGLSNLVLAVGGFAVLAWLGWAGLRFLRPAGIPGNRQWKENLQPGFLTFWNMIAYSFIYLAVTLISMSVYDAATLFENRILAPVYLSLILGLAVMAGWLWRQDGVVLRLLVLAAMAGVVSLSAWNQVRKVDGMRFDAQGFASRIWRESELVSVIRNLPPGKVIYTNKPTLVYIQTGRVSNILPTPYDTALGLARETFDADLVQLRARADQERAAIAILGWEWMDSPDGEAWYQQMILGLTAVTSTSEGALFLAHP